jgi:hypothetical protein
MKDIGDIVARGKPHFVARSSVEMDHHVLDHLSFLDVLLQQDNAARGGIFAILYPSGRACQRALDSPNVIDDGQ